MSRGTDKRICAEMTLMRMCSGSTWDFSPEALAERISSLEARLAEVGVFAAPRPTFNSTEPVSKPISAQSIVKTLEKKEQASEKKTVPASTSSDFVTQPKKEETTVAKPEVSDEGLEWTEFPEWIEIVSQYDKIDRSISPFLRLATADTDGKTLRIKVSDTFSKTMLENAKIEDFVMRFSASKGFMFSDIVIEVSLVQDDQISMFDSLL